jgi:hypothetical protein
MAERNALAFIGGFRRPEPGRAQGTHQSAYLTFQALATIDRYAAIYVANGEQIVSAPHLLRPADDWAPVVCSVGTAHANGQWANLFLSFASGAIRPTDAFIFKSQAARSLFRQIFEQWSQRFGWRIPTITPVVPNGVDTQRNRRSEDLRAQARRQLGIEPQSVVYLSFSRLDPGIKGDLEALVLNWKRVVASAPRVLLVLAGASADREYVGHLGQLARATGAAGRIVVIDNPRELFPDARASLMSAADVFLHPSTGLEEASPLAVHEAQAFGLPVIAARWAGIPEVVTHGETGYLFDTRAAPLRPSVATTFFGETDRTHLVHAVPSGVTGAPSSTPRSRSRTTTTGPPWAQPPAVGRKGATCTRWPANTLPSSRPPVWPPRMRGPVQRPVARWSPWSTSSRLRPPRC